VDVGSKDIEKWIGQVVSKTHKASGKTICPFAKRTLQDKKIQITLAKKDVLAQINHCCSLFNIFHLDVVILYFNHKIAEQRLAKVCRQAHELNKAFAVMYDHPANSGKHKGVSFSYGKAPLIFIQDLNKLKQAQQKLKDTGYYEAWGIKDYEQFY